MLLTINERGLVKTIEMKQIVVICDIRRSFMRILTPDFKGNIPSPFVTLSPKPKAGIVSQSLNGSSVSPRIQIT